ncbi:MAG: STAS domain-containing protein [Chloroflexales bacterium]|nr:STAS domain-containing protein [Chloroflexales bacterium]
MNTRYSCGGPQGRAITILRPGGALDWSTYETLIAQARTACADGAWRLVVDLRDVTQVTTTGLVALHTVARLVAGQPPVPPEDGWAAIRALAEEPNPRQRLALVGPQPPVERAIARLPFSAALAIYDSPEAALAALARRSDSSELCRDDDRQGADEKSASDGSSHRAYGGHARRA